jgi:hypothetical protein
MLVLEILKAIGYPLVVFTNRALLFFFQKLKIKIKILLILFLFNTSNVTKTILKVT